MPEIIIVAGPNGAGKTTFANEYLQLERARFVYINADEIAGELMGPTLSDAHRNLRAGREMLLRIDAAVSEGRDLMFETTLATLNYVQKIPKWQTLDYRVSLLYLSLPSVETSIERVQRRRALGGHDIPEETIRRRYGRSAAYLEKCYKPMVNEWEVWDSLEGEFRLRERGSR
jgi:predicted ABC-type ATPase